MNPPPTPPTNPPDSAFFGAANAYLGTLAPEQRQIISIMLLRTLSAIRISSVDDTDMLRACSKLEDKLLTTLAHSASSLTPKRTVYDTI